MRSDEVEQIRKELFQINTQIAFIEKNHHLEGIELEEANKRLKELKDIQELLRFRLRNAMYEDISSRDRGGRRWK